MAELKTQKNAASVASFLAGVEDKGRREDALAVCKLMQEASKEKPAMWGNAIVGFGSQKLVYESGRELDWMVVGFSPRKANTVLYGIGVEKQAELLKTLGKYKTGKGCLYISKLADVDVKVLKELVRRAMAPTKK